MLMLGGTIDIIRMSGRSANKGKGEMNDQNSPTRQYFNLQMGTCTGNPPAVRADVKPQWNEADDCEMLS